MKSPYIWGLEVVRAICAAAAVVGVGRLHHRENPSVDRPAQWYARVTVLPHARGLRDARRQANLRSARHVIAVAPARRGIEK